MRLFEQWDEVLLDKKTFAALSARPAGDGQKRKELPRVPASWFSMFNHASFIQAS
jgi:hypothetical protein